MEARAWISAQNETNGKGWGESIELAELQVRPPKHAKLLVRSGASLF